jgi:hypothetical protein
MKQHKVTEIECREAWSIFADRAKYLSLSDEQTVMVDACVEAGQMFRETGAWPTLEEVEQKWMQEAAERARKRDAMIADCAAHNANKKA